MADSASCVEAAIGKSALTVVVDWYSKKAFFAARSKRVVLRRVPFPSSV